MGPQMTLPVDVPQPNGSGSPKPTIRVPAPPDVPVTPKASNSAPLLARSRELSAPGLAPSRPPVAGPGVRRLGTVTMVIVAVAAAATSYEHQRALAASVGEGWRAWLLPLSVDGLMVAASMGLRVRRAAGEPARLAWLSLILGAVVSMAANVAAAQPSWEGRAVAAWPPLAVLLVNELWMQTRGGGAGVQTVRPHRSNTVEGGGRDG